MRDYSKLKARAELDEMCNERFTNIAPSDLIELIDDLLCPACKGSGEGWMLSDSGPDAHHIQVDCQECNGRGTLFGAYESMKSQLNILGDRYVASGGELFFMRIERDQLKAENEALRKDAERYRWLEKASDYDREFAMAHAEIGPYLDEVMSKN